MSEQVASELLEHASQSISYGRYGKESRTEIRKVVWPTRMETTQTFMIVFGSIIILCLFFWGLESLLSFLTSLVLG